jgi:hypothetical protein
MSDWTEVPKIAASKKRKDVALKRKRVASVLDKEAAKLVKKDE